MEVAFDSPRHLAAESAAKQFVNGRIVWLDAKKSRFELMPARIVHRIHDVLTDIVADQIESNSSKS